MFTLTVTSQIVGDGLGLSSQATVETDACDKVVAVITADATNQEVDLPIDISAVKGLVFLANAAMTIKTNSTSEPNDTIPLLAGRDNTYIEGQGAIQLTADVTKLYVTSEAGGSLTIWVYRDATPGE